MNDIVIENQLCVFVLNITDPLKSLAGISNFFEDRKINVDMLLLQRIAHNTKLVIQCRIERDRISLTVAKLEKIPGVMSLEWMKAK